MVLAQTPLIYLKQLVWSGLDPSSVLSRETNSRGVEWGAAIFYNPGVWLPSSLSPRSLHLPSNIT